MRATPGIVPNCCERTVQMTQTNQMKSTHKNLVSRPGGRRENRSERPAPPGTTYQRTCTGHRGRGFGWNGRRVGRPEHVAAGAGAGDVERSSRTCQFRGRSGWPSVARAERLDDGYSDGRRFDGGYSDGRRFGVPPGRERTEEREPFGRWSDSVADLARRRGRARGAGRSGRSESWLRRTGHFVG
jgi:hypothetical protein